MNDKYVDLIVKIGEAKSSAYKAGNIIDKYALGLELPSLIEEIVTRLEEIEKELIDSKAQTEVADEADQGM